MFLKVTEARYLETYRIEVAFNKGKKGIADLSEVLQGSVSEPLKHVEWFANFNVDEKLETVVWENGADLAPEYFYYQTFKYDPEQPQFKEWGYVR